MKKFFVLIISLFVLFGIPEVNAESWDDFADLDRAWDGQKTITNKEFEDVMDALQAKTKKKEARQRKRKIRKISGGGNSLHDELNPDKTIPELQSLKPESEELLINLPVNLIIDGKVLDKGYYNVTAERDKNDKKIYINFYQSHYLIAKVEATETEDDYGEEKVDFAEIKGYNNSHVKLVFGSIDFNAFVYIPFIE